MNEKPFGIQSSRSSSRRQSEIPESEPTEPISPLRMLTDLDAMNAAAELRTPLFG